MEDFHSELFENNLWSSNIKQENNKNDSNESTVSSQEKAIIKKSNQSSYIWKYYRPLQNSGKGYECIICNRRVSLHRGNLNRHLSIMHNIAKLSGEGRVCKKKGTSSKSFVWKYCTKETNDYARCHLCKSLLYFGGGGTSNISKHLWRKHNNILMEMENENKEVNSVFKVSHRRQRKGPSYVWKYTDRLSSQSVRCKLCKRKMSFHGTANLIHHLERVHEITERTPISTENLAKNAESEKDTEKSTENLAKNAESEADESSADMESLLKEHKNPNNARSLVWKYYEHISSERVRCTFCKRDFVNQGTSNLRRHVQRMHGVLCDGTEIPRNPRKRVGDFIDQLYTYIDEEHAQCSMCDELLTITCKNDIVEHAKNIHKITSKNVKTKEEIDSKDDEMENMNEIDNTNNEGSTNLEYDGQDMKNYFDMYSQEDKYADSQDSFEAEKPFELPISNPLSPRSSKDHFVNFNELSKGSPYNKTWQKLKEERLSAETEYFREKAGFYRMQKYLTALQAKKVRAELDKFNRDHDP